MFSDEQLLSADFDEAAYLQHTLQLPSFDAEQSRIARCIDTVDSELQSAIADNAGDLVENVAKLNQAAAGVDAVQQSVAGAQSSLTRLRHVIRDPYAQIEGGVAELRNCSAAVEMVRAVYRFLAIVSKLKECEGDAARSARLLREVEELLNEHDIVGIEAVDAAMPVVSKTSVTVRSKAMELLRNAMSRHSHADLGLAVQCFASLGTLAKVVGDAVAERKREALTVIVKQLSPSILQTEGADGAFTKIDGALQIIVDHATALGELWKALRRKDAATQRPFIDLVAAASDPAALLGDFWKAVSEHLADHLQRICRKGALHAMVVAEFARFHRILAHFTGNLRDFFAAMVGEARDSPAVASVARAKSDVWMQAAVGTVEEQFRLAVRERHREKLAALSSRIASACPAGGADRETVDIAADPKASAALPSVVCSFDQPIRALVKAVHHDLAVNRPDEHALVAVLEIAAETLASAGKALSDGLGKLPRAAAGELPSVAVSATSGDLYRMSISNAAAVLAGEMQAALAMLPRLAAVTSASTNDTIDAAGAARSAVEALQKICGRVVAPFFESASIAIARTIDDLFPADGIVDTDNAPAKPSVTKVHPNAPAPAQHTSARGAQLHSRIWHFLTRFGLMFDHQSPALEDAQRQLCDTLSRQFIAHVVTCTPKDSAARQVLAADMNGFASAVGAVYSVDRLGATGRALRHAAKVYAGPVPSADEAKTLAQRGHPATLLLALLGRVDEKDIAVGLATAARVSRDDIRATVAAALEAGNTRGCAKLWEAVVRSSLADVDVNQTEAVVDEAATAAAKARHEELVARLTAAKPATEEGEDASAAPTRLPAAPEPVMKRVPSDAAKVKTACLALEASLVPR